MHSFRSLPQLARFAVLFLLLLPLPALAQDLEIGPIAGLTESWHQAPATSAVPLGTPIQLRIPVSKDQSVRWTGAQEISRQQGWSVAEVRIDAASPHLVTATLVSGRGERRLGQMLLQGDNRAPQITLALHEDHGSTSALELAGRSPLVQEGNGSYRTSVDRPLRAEATVWPASYAPLVEWQLPEGESRLGLVQRVAFSAPGTYSLGAGGQQLRLQTYGVHVEQVGESLLARTEPTGFENELRWAAGEGGRITDRGDWQSLNRLQLVGPGSLTIGTVFIGPVSVRPVRPIAIGSCGRSKVLAMREGSGRPLGSTGNNGFLTFPYQLISTSGAKSCASLSYDGRASLMARGIVVIGTGRQNQGTTQTNYNVGGSNLSQASNNIFDPQTGAGPSEGGTRYAGEASMEYSTEFSMSSGGNGTVEVQINKVDWSTDIKTPEWDGKDGASQGEQDEWDRFSDKLQEHEQGHVDRYNDGMKKVEDKLAGKPAGKLTVEANKIPEYDEEGNPKTEEDQQAHDAIMDAVNNAVEGSQEFQDMETEQTNYDAPPSETNPGGTNHGATQGATLNTNP